MGCSLSSLHTCRNRHKRKFGSGLHGSSCECQLALHFTTCSEFVVLKRPRFGSSYPLNLRWPWAVDKCLCTQPRDSGTAPRHSQEQNMLMHDFLGSLQMPKVSYGNFCCWSNSVWLRQFNFWQRMGFTSCDYKNCIANCVGFVSLQGRATYTEKFILPIIQQSHLTIVT